jgi:hypothetical protein
MMLVAGLLIVATCLLHQRLLDRSIFLHIAVADGITIKLGTYIWTFGWNFVLYLVIAAIVGLVAESVMWSRLPLGFVGAIAAALIGIWLMTYYTRT